MNEIFTSNVLSKEFLYYCRISTKEGFDTDTEKAHLDIYIDKTKSSVCNLCPQVFIITRNCKENENSCNSCVQITSDIDKDGKMHRVWRNTKKFRVFTNLWRCFAQEIMNKEDIVEKYGYVDVDKYNARDGDDYENNSS